jgi:hypothetical protein
MGARRATSMARPIAEADPSGAWLRAQRAQRRGHRGHGVPVVRPPAMVRTMRCGVILQTSFSEWRWMRRARSWRTGLTEVFYRG